MSSGTTAKFGWPDHSSSFVFMQPVLKSAYHYLTNVVGGAESENIYQAIALLKQYIFS